jgi:DNA invertase Pin-like site-specific DNA recombinase
MTRQGKRRQQQHDGLMKALIYTRVSKDEQAKDGLSLPAQLRACRRYAADRGWVIGGEH